MQDHRTATGSGQQLRETEDVCWLQQLGQCLSLFSKLQATPNFALFLSPSLSIVKTSSVKYKQEEFKLQLLKP